MKIKILKYWCYFYIDLDGKMFGPMSKDDAEMAQRRAPTASRRDMLNFLRVTKND